MKKTTIAIFITAIMFTISTAMGASAYCGETQRPVLDNDRQDELMNVVTSIEHKARQLKRLSELTEKIVMNLPEWGAYTYAFVEPSPSDVDTLLTAIDKDLSSVQNYVNDYALPERSDLTKMQSPLTKVLIAQTARAKTLVSNLKIQCAEAASRRKMLNCRLPELFASIRDIEHTRTSLMVEIIKAQAEKN